jgi:hypothetical protein
VLQTQILLSYFRKHRPDGFDPTDYGVLKGDFTGVDDARFERAVSSYQAWSTALDAPLPVEGKRGDLDRATYDSIVSTCNAFAAAENPNFDPTDPGPGPVQPATPPDPIPEPAPGQPLPASSAALASVPTPILIAGGIAAVFGLAAVALR